MRAFITGVSGFTGVHLAAELAAQVDVQRVGGIGRRAATPASLDGADVDYTSVDILDAEGVRRVLAEFGPTHVFHLASLPQARGAEDDRLYEVNVLGTVRLLQAARGVVPDAVVVLAGSSACYGDMREHAAALREDDAFDPVTHYAASKVAQEMVALVAQRAAGLAVVRARSFNLVGPGQPSSLFASAVARQIAAAELGLAEPVLTVGNLDGIRDFVDVRDAARAYVLLARAGVPGEVYNICTGRGTPLSACLELLLAMSKVSMRVQSDPNRLLGRAQDVRRQVGDYSRIHLRTGWTPLIPLEQSMADLLDAWRAKLMTEAMV